jgi:hypothetical protein
LSAWPRVRPQPQPHGRPASPVMRTTRQSRVVMQVRRHEKMQTQAGLFAHSVVIGHYGYDMQDDSQSHYACQATILYFSLCRKRYLISHWCLLKRNRAQATHRSCFDHAVELVLQRLFKGANGPLGVSLSFLIYIASFCILQV